eukprot:6304995-Prymnesium_polylepis.4
MIPSDDSGQAAIWDRVKDSQRAECRACICGGTVLGSIPDCVLAHLIDLCECSRHTIVGLVASYMDEMGRVLVDAICAQAASAFIIRHVKCLRHESKG